MRPSVVRRWLFAAAMTCTTIVHAEGPPPLRLDDLVAEARERSPLLQAARERARAASFAPAQAKVLDDPVFSYEAWNTPDNFNIAKADNNILRIAQKIPFPGKRRLAGEVAARGADAAARDADAMEREVVAAVKTAYAELWLAHQNVEVYRRDRTLVEHFARIAEQRYAVGSAVQPDVLRAQVELTHEINRETTERLSIDAAGAALNAVLSRDPGTPLGPPEPLAPPVLPAGEAELVERALGERPELQSQDAMIAREEDAVRLAKLGNYPDFEVSAGRFINAGASDGFGAMVSISLPFVHRGKYAAAVSEAEARVAAARADRRRLEDTVRRDVTQAYIRARQALLQYQLFTGTHIPHVEQTLRATEAAYQAGSVDFLALIDSVRAIEEVHLEHIAAQAEFMKAVADLERAVGTEL